MKSFLTILVFIGPTFGFSQDSLVRINEVAFQSPLEQKAFTSYFSQEEPKNYIQLFMALGKMANEEAEGVAESRINQIVADINKTDFQKKKPQKQIKGIYTLIHDALLRKYELENRFYELFTSGNYNCVTATALYAIIFDRLQIPYAIKEEPTHVYLVAYPDVHNILVETTTPASGFINFDAVYKNEYVNKLKSQKLIGTSEAETYNTEQLFNKYYFSKESIDLGKLVGIHYMNDALFLRESGDIQNAFAQAEKAYLFNPTERCQYLITSFGIDLLNDSKINPLEKSKLIAKLSRYKQMGITNDMIKGEFARLTQDLIVKQNDKAQYAACYATLIKGIDDRTLREDITYYYDYENGRIYYNQGAYKNARNYFRSALKLQPNNMDLGVIFSQALAQTFSTENSSSFFVDTLLMYKHEFPSLMEIQNFRSMLGTSYLIKFHDLYASENPAEGEKFRLLFEDLYKEKDHLIINTDAIAMAYSSACTYYFKKGQKTKAKEFVAKGLEFAPGNYELRVRQQMLSR